jgi:RNA polymerase sigma-70 factor (ECF subfamily)
VRAHRELSSEGGRGRPRLEAPAESEPRYEELYQAHHDRVMRLCRVLLGDASEGDDVAQEVFLKVLHECQAGTRPIAWGRWITQVAVNACHDRRRSGWWRWWRRGGEAFDDRHAPSPATPEAHVLSGERRRRIWRAFSKLPPRQREVFALRYVEGWSTQETAALLGIDGGSVKRHLLRAVRRLRDALGDDR